MTDFVSSISNGLETMYNASTKSKKVFAIIILILLIYPTLELGVDSVTQQPPPPAPDQALPPAPLMKPVKVFLLITGQTYQAHQQILDKLNAQGSKVMITDAQQCDLILLFCPILSRVRSDVEAAFRKIPEDAQGKQVVLVQMHHTRKPEQVLNQIQWKEQFPIIIQDVQVLYHETQNGLLQCPRNERALHALQSMFAEFENKMATQRFFGKRSREKSSDLNTDSVSEDPVYKGALETMYNASTKSMAAFAIIILILLIDPTLDALETMYNAYTDFKKPFSIFILILLFYPTFHALETMYNASTKSKKVFPIIILILLIYPTLDALEKMYNASLKSKKVFAIIILTLLIYLTLGALETMYNASTKSMAAFAILILILLIDLHSDALEKMRNAYTEPTVLVAMFMLTLLSYRTLKGLKTIYNIYTKYMELFNINIKPLFKLQPSDALKKMPDASPKSMAAFAILILILFIHRTLKALKTIYNIFNKLLEAFILIILTLFIRLPLVALITIDNICTKFMELFNINIEPLFNLQPSEVLKTINNIFTKSKAAFEIIIQTLFNLQPSEIGVDSVTQQPPTPAPDQGLLPAPVMKPVKVFLLIITGQTYQAHQQILDKLNAQGSKVMITDAQQCDLILLFCPILSQVQYEVEAAFRKIPEDAQGKQVVLVQMHHTRKPAQVLNQIQWKEQFPIIIQDVQVLYHETQNGLLQCPRNERALHALQSMFVEFKNKMATQSNTTLSEVKGDGSM
ncbi:uncharacterized protein LOC117381165 isoform X2 [Periophthalmus magnuspinnatus]|uniref:uncharacterized protein LOC117381165 isoform X2 n=1 Tax=Periophthalmus magnuspinnatus TaxID=409849 RepID=UPI0024373BAC|nr:uncharacterized protein LOC117381165 isoform X2 [Periophthalmus magnuspinnatus]